jgi:hypothetical protein
LDETVERLATESADGKMLERFVVVIERRAGTYETLPEHAEFSGRRQEGRREDAIDSSGSQKPEARRRGDHATTMEDHRAADARFDAHELVGEPEPLHEFPSLRTGDEETVGGSLNQPAIVPRGRQNAAGSTRRFDERHAAAD